MTNSLDAPARADAYPHLFPQEEAFRGCAQIFVPVSDDKHADGSVSASTLPLLNARDLDLWTRRANSLPENSKMAIHISRVRTSSVHAEHRLMFSHRVRCET